MKKKNNNNKRLDSIGYMHLDIVVFYLFVCFYLFIFKNKTVGSSGVSKNHPPLLNAYKISSFVLSLQMLLLLVVVNTTI